MKCLREHSLSISLFIAGVLASLFAWPNAPEDGSYWYDWWLMVAGSCFGGAVIVFLSRYLWEKDARPEQPPS
jgi:hypothetical protein